METGNPIRVMVAYEQTLLREAIIGLLQREEGLQVVGEATTGREVLNALEGTQLDVLLLDLGISDVDLLEILPQIHARRPSAKLLILTQRFDQDLIVHALRNGAMGYLLKSMPSAELLKAIRAVYAGEVWVERSVIGQLLQKLPHPANNTSFKVRRRSSQPLTRRETEITKLVADGFTNKEIADALFISEKTVKCHLSNIFRKIRVNHRTQLVLYVLEGGPLSSLPLRHV